MFTVKITKKMISGEYGLKINCKKLWHIHSLSRILEMTSSLDVRQKQRAVIEFFVSDGEPTKNF